MNDLCSIDPHGAQATITRHGRKQSVLRVRAIQVVRHPPPQPIKLNACANQVAAFCRDVHLNGQMLRLQNLDLQCNTQDIIRPAVAKANQCLATL